MYKITIYKSFYYILGFRCKDVSGCSSYAAIKKQIHKIMVLRETNKLILKKFSGQDDHNDMILNAKGFIMCPLKGKLSTTLPA